MNLIDGYKFHAELYCLGEESPADREPLGKVMTMLEDRGEDIIRCKDCVHYTKALCKVWSRFGTIQTPHNGYCHMAERKTNEN